MKKALKIFFSTLSTLIILVVLVPIVIAMLLQVGFVQKWAVDKATEMLTEKAGTRFSISKVEIGLFNRAYFEDVYIEGPRGAGDTMIYVKKIDASINGINFFNGKISLGNVTVAAGKIYLYKDSLEEMNVKTVFDNFKPKVPNQDPPNFRLSAAQVNLLGTTFKLDDYTVEPQTHGVNFKALDLRDITFQAQNVNVLNYDVKLAINHLSFSERSGFSIRHLSSPRCGVNETGMRYANLRVETPHTTLVCSHFNLLYQSWWDYNDFVNKVTLDAQIEPSKIAFPTIEYFIREPLDIPTNITLQGSIVGIIPNLVGNLESISIIGGTELSGNFTITGLPNVKNTTFNFGLHHLTTNAYAIDTLIKQITHKPLSLAIQQILTRSGTIHANGDFYGLLTDFNTNCHVNTLNGDINAQLKVKPATSGGVNFIGQVQTDNYDLKATLGAPALGTISLAAGVDATISGKNVDLKTTARIGQFDMKGYSYGPITMDGKFAGKVFTGTLCSDLDSNLLFHTNGTFDFVDPQNPAYNFEMNLEKANLVALGLNQRDSISQLSAQFQAHFTGSNIDNINGEALIDSIYYVNHMDTVHTAAISITADNSAQQKEIELRSHFADIHLQGRNSYSNIFGYLAKMARTYIPAFPEATEVVTGSPNALPTTPVAEKTYDDGFYTLKVRVKEANNVAAIFLPGLEIASGTSLDFFFNPAQNRFSFNLLSDYILRDNFYVDNINLDSRNVADSLSVYLTTNELGIGNISLPDFSVIGGIKNNRIYLGTRFADHDKRNSAILNTTTNIYRTPQGLAQINITLHPSNFRLDNHSWNLTQSQILLDSTGVGISNFNLRSAGQLLSLNGKMGRAPSDTITMALSNLNLAPLSILVKDLGYSISGTAGGTVQGMSILREPQFAASVDFNNITFGNYPLGNSMLRSQLAQNRRRIGFTLTTSTGMQPVTGYYNIPHKRYNVNMNFPELDMVLLEPLLKGILTDTKGSAAVDLVLSGGAGTPTLNGEIHFDKYAATVDFTKVRYTFGGDITVKDNRFTLAPTPIHDPNGHTGEISAFFDSRYFKNLTFGVNAKYENLLALKTTAKENPFFYGTGYGTGTLAITGTETLTSLKIAAQTAANSSIFLPFSNVSTADRANFITFVDPKEPKDTISSRKQMFRKKQRTKLQNELDISIDLQVLPNTTALIQYSTSFMDNIIQGQGRGRLRMHINPSQDIFTIDGPIEIEKGSYRLILAIADKTFTLQNGGRLQWTGSPSNPNVDFTGVYKVRASLEPLTGTMGGGNTKTNIDCGIKLTETLMTPNISFTITAPSATPETQNILRNSLNTEEAMSMQFMSLFMSGSFMPDVGTSGIGTVSGSILSTTGFEFLSSQIGSMISGKNFNIRPTFRPKTETSAEEFGVQASVSLLEDRIYIEAEGNYATSPTTNQQSTPFTGGGGVTVLLNKAGTLSLKGFTRVIDRFDETQGLQESGVGVYFRQSFQNLEDLKKRYKAYLDKLKENREKNKLKRTTRDATKNQTESKTKD